MKLERIYILRRRDKRRPGYGANTPYVFAVLTITKGKWRSIPRHQGSLWIENGTEGRSYDGVIYPGGNDIDALFLLKNCVTAAVASLGQEESAGIRKKILRIAQDIANETGDFENCMSRLGYLPERIK